MINSYKFTSSYTIASIEALNALLLASDVSVFLSTSDASVYWYGDLEVNFYLYEVTGLPHTQTNYLNFYTIYDTNTAQKAYCPTLVSKDYWAISSDYCADGYTYQFALSPTVTSTLDCYVMSQNYTSDAIQSRYVGRQLFDNCEPIGTKAFSAVIIEYWNWANAAYQFQLKFLTILSDMYSDFSTAKSEITSKISKINTYYTALYSAYTKLADLQNRIELYYSTMNCSMVNDLTQQEYVGLCGAILENLFMLSVFIGALGTCNMFFSLGIVLFLFRHRTDLEIEQEKIMRSIGQEEDFEKTQRNNETGINKD